MTDAQLATLRTELADDPGARGYAALLAAGNDQGLAELLNAVEVGITVTVPVTQRAVLKRLMVLGKCKALKDAADQGLNAAAWNTWEVLKHPAFALIDLFDAASQAQMGALVSSGVLTAEDRASVESLGQRRGSRVEQLFGAGVACTRADIAGAR